MSTRIYFAIANSDPINRVTFKLWDWQARPLNILVPFMPPNGIRSWNNRDYETPGVRTILDSGAFSAWKSGTEVVLEDLIVEACDRQPAWDEVAALDPIGDPLASHHNAVEMKLRGIPTIPIFHYGEPWELLTEYKNYFGDRIGLGGIATGISSVQKRKWLAQCFARAYPARFHGFGVASKDLLLEFPFFSIDTASWHTGLRFGRSAAMPDLKMPRKSTLDGSTHEDSAYDMRFELEHYLKMEAEIQDRWKSELAWAV